MTTPDLVEALVADAAPVKRLRPPAIRAGGWLIVALAVASLLAAVKGVRPDLASHLADPRFLASLLGGRAPRGLAAGAPVSAPLPDRSRLWWLLPLPAAALWATTIGYGCLAVWFGVPPAEAGPGPSLACAALIAGTGLPLWGALLLMQRHLARISSLPVVVLGGFAVAALSAAILALFHEVDATLLVVLTHAAILVPLIGAASWLGRRLPPRDAFPLSNAR